MSFNLTVGDSYKLDVGNGNYLTIDGVIPSVSHDLFVGDGYKLNIGNGNYLTIGTGSTSKARRWNGDNWDVFNTLSYFDGTNMVSTTNVKFYVGGTWVNLF